MGPERFCGCRPTDNCTARDRFYLGVFIIGIPQKQPGDYQQKRMAEVGQKVEKNKRGLLFLGNICKIKVLNSENEIRCSEFEIRGAKWEAGEEACAKED
jgi:hypothetical protein